MHVNATRTLALEIEIFVVLAHSRSQFRTANYPGKFKNMISFSRSTQQVRDEDHGTGDAEESDPVVELAIEGWVPVS